MGSGEITDPGLEGFSDEAFEEPGEGGLTTEQLAFRIHAKREQAAQDAGWLEPPGPDEESERLVTEPELEPEEEAPEPEEEDSGQAAEAEEPEEEEEPEEDEFYLVTPTSKYRDRESAEEGVAEQARLLQAQFEELRQYRQQLEQQQAQQQAEQQQRAPEVFDARGWAEWSAEVVEQGHGARGAERALVEGGREAHNIYMAHWKNSDDPDERIAAHIYDADVTRMYAAHQAVQAVQPFIEQQQEQTVVTEAEQARELAAAGKDDFDELAPEMDRLISDEDGLLPRELKQNLTAMAQGGGVVGKRMAWEYLYNAAKAARAPERVRATSTERRRRTTTAEAARIAATVSSSEGSGTRTPLDAAGSAELQKRNAIRKELGQPLLEEP